MDSVTSDSVITVSRRRLMLGASAAATVAVLGFDPQRRRWVTTAMAEEAPDFARLPRLDGTLHLDEATRRTYAEDFGLIVHEFPLAVLKAGSVEDVARMIRFARRFHIRLVSRGRGHTTYGQAQVEAGIVVDLSGIRQIHRIERDRVVASAGIRWREVLEATLAHGLMPPVLTDYIGQSVGGTLSVGGIGGSAWRYGAQVDNVLELEVVTGEGERLTCSAERRPDLFNAALAGQGQCAMITRAVLRLQPAPTHVRVFNLFYSDAPALTREVFRLTAEGRFEHVEAWLFRAPNGQWTPMLEAVSFYTPPNLPDNDRLLAGLNHLPAPVQVQDQSFWEWANRVPLDLPRQAHPWIDLFVPGPAIDGFIAAAQPELVPVDPRDSLSVLMMPFHRDRLHRPLFRTPSTPQIMYFGVLRFTPPEPALISPILALNRRLFDRNRALGGTHYPISAVELSRLDWQRHYQPHWDALVSAKRRYDPDNVFASGPDIFGDQRR